MAAFSRVQMARSSGKEGEYGESGEGEVRENRHFISAGIRCTGWRGKCVASSGPARSYHITA